VFVGEDGGEVSESACGGGDVRGGEGGDGGGAFMCSGGGGESDEGGEGRGGGRGDGAVELVLFER